MLVALHARVPCCPQRRLPADAGGSAGLVGPYAGTVARGAVPVGGGKRSRRWRIPCEADEGPTVVELLVAMTVAALLLTAVAGHFSVDLESDHVGGRSHRQWTSAASAESWQSDPGTACQCLVHLDGGRTLPSLPWRFGRRPDDAGTSASSPRGRRSRCTTWTRADSWCARLVGTLPGAAVQPSRHRWAPGGAAT